MPTESPGIRQGAVTLWSCLPAAVTAAVVVLMYRRGVHDEAGSRAGAEPVLAGVFVALPFVALLMFELLGVLGMAVVRSRRGRAVCWGVTTVSAMLMVAAFVWLGRDVPRDPPSHYTLGVALLVPMLPVWVLLARTPSDAVAGR